MSRLRTTLADDVTELAILWPHLAYALERDAGVAEGERVSADGHGFGLPLNADVLVAMAALETRLPALLRWACAVVAEPMLATTDLGVLLRHVTRLHERMLVTAAAGEADSLAGDVHRLLREVKLALGLRTQDRLLGQFCPLHDDPLRELVAPGDDSTLKYSRVDSAGQPINPTVEWVRSEQAYCRHCKSAWTPGQYLLLGRLLRQADARRVAARGVAEQLQGGAACAS